MYLSLLMVLIFKEIVCQPEIVINEIVNLGLTTFVEVNYKDNVNNVNVTNNVKLHVISYENETENLNLISEKSINFSKDKPFEIFSYFENVNYTQVLILLYEGKFEESLLLLMLICVTVFFLYFLSRNTSGSSYSTG